MKSSNETKMDIETSMESGLLKMFKFERVPITAVITSNHCTNPYCPCRDVTLDFFDASAKFVNRLFKLVINYETWQLESSEVFDHDLDCAEMIDEFMSALDEQDKAGILSGIEPKAQREHPLRDDIELPGFGADRMVHYSEIYRIEPYENLIFELNGKAYFVLDYYCPKTKCNCKEVVLSFYLVDEGTVKGDPIMTYRVKLETGRGTVEDKDISVSLRFAKDLYNGLYKIFGGDGISIFENRYRKIKEWGRHTSALRMLV